MPALPAAAAPSLLPAPRRAVGPAAAVRAPRPPARRTRTHSGDARGSTRRSLRGPHGGIGDTEARAGTRRDPDARRPQRRWGGAHAHKGMRATDTGNGVQGAVRHTPKGGGGGTCRPAGPHGGGHKTQLHTEGHPGAPDTCKIHRHSRTGGKVLRTEIYKNTAEPRAHTAHTRHTDTQEITDTLGYPQT